MGIIAEHYWEQNLNFTNVTTSGTFVIDKIRGKFTPTSLSWDTLGGYHTNGWTWQAETAMFVDVMSSSVTNQTAFRIGPTRNHASIVYTGHQNYWIDNQVRGTSWGASGDFQDRTVVANQWYTFKWIFRTNGDIEVYLKEQYAPNSTYLGIRDIPAGWTSGTIRFAINCADAYDKPNNSMFVKNLIVTDDLDYYMAEPGTSVITKQDNEGDLTDLTAIETEGTITAHASGYIHCVKTGTLAWGTCGFIGNKPRRIQAGDEITFRMRYISSTANRKIPVGLSTTSNFSTATGDKYGVHINGTSLQTYTDTSGYGRQVTLPGAGTWVYFKFTIKNRGYVSWYKLGITDDWIWLHTHQSSPSFPDRPLYFHSDCPSANGEWDVDLMTHDTGGLLTSEPTFSELKDSDSFSAGDVGWTNTQTDGNVTVSGGRRIYQGKTVAAWNQLGSVRTAPINVLKGDQLLFTLGEMTGVAGVYNAIGFLGFSPTNTLTQADTAGIGTWSGNTIMRYDESTIDYIQIGTIFDELKQFRAIFNEGGALFYHKWFPTDKAWTPIFQTLKYAQPTIMPSPTNIYIKINVRDVQSTNVWRIADYQIGIPGVPEREAGISSAVRWQKILTKKPNVRIARRVKKGK